MCARFRAYPVYQELHFLKEVLRHGTNQIGYDMYYNLFHSSLIGIDMLL